LDAQSQKHHVLVIYPSPSHLLLHRRLRLAPPRCCRIPLTTPLLPFSLSLSPTPRIVAPLSSIHSPGCGAWSAYSSLSPRHAGHGLPRSPNAIVKLALATISPASVPQILLGSPTIYLPMIPSTPFISYFSQEIRGDLTHLLLQFLDQGAGH
jgi:hypothetical protein